MEEVAISSMQPANPVKDANAHLTGTSKVQHNMAEQHWLAGGTDNPGMASNVARVVIDGILFKTVVSIAGQQKVGLIDSGASRCYMSPETIAICELQLNPEILHLELANGSKVQSTQKADKLWESPSAGVVLQ